MKKIARRALAGAVVGATRVLGQKQALGFTAFKMAELSSKREATGKPWLQFFDNSSMYLGVYSLGAGSADGQGPHKEDEIYYVVSGRGKFRAADEETAVEPGAILFVKAGVVHKFHSIEERLELLVFFSKGKA